MTGLVFFAPWASARGVLLLRIFERKGVFLDNFVRNYSDSKAGSQLSTMWTTVPPFAICDGSAPKLSEFRTTPHDELIAICDKRTKGRLSGCDKLSQPGAVQPVRISDFYHSSATVAELKGAALQASTTRFQPLCGWGGIFYRLEGKRACPGAGGATPDVLILWCTLPVSGNF